MLATDNCELLVLQIPLTLLPAPINRVAAASATNASRRECSTRFCPSFWRQKDRSVAPTSPSRFRIEPFPFRQRPPGSAAPLAPLEDTTCLVQLATLDYCNSWPGCQSLLGCLKRLTKGLQRLTIMGWVSNAAYGEHRERHLNCGWPRKKCSNGERRRQIEEYKGLIRSTPGYRMYRLRSWSLTMSAKCLRT